MRAKVSLPFLASVHRIFDGTVLPLAENIHEVRVVFVGLGAARATEAAMRAFVHHLRIDRGIQGAINAQRSVNGLRLLFMPRKKTPCVCRCVILNLRSFSSC